MSSAEVRRGAAPWRRWITGLPSTENLATATVTLARPLPIRGACNQLDAESEMLYDPSEEFASTVMHYEEVVVLIANDRRMPGMSTGAQA